MHKNRTQHKDRRRLVMLVLIIACLCTPLGCTDWKSALVFPFDHGPHFDVVNEWWYFTGEAQTAEGKTLGFEFTIFKRWVQSLDDFAYLGHVAVSDPETAQHFFAEVQTLEPLSDIEEGKTIIEINSFSYAFSEAEGFSIKAETEVIALDLQLALSMDVLPHGQDGIIVMGDGLNSYYYSCTNLLTAGSISINGSEYVVSSGRTWMDHQWGDYTLQGMLWDWFSLRLDDDSALMLFQFRDIADNVVESNWTYRSGTGAVTYGEEFSVQAARLYKDENGNCTYPVDWTVEVPDIEAWFSITPLFDEQSLYDVMTPNYWEGLCAAAGELGGEAVTGSAYVELTGYED